jgi:hypothetical protein
METVTPQPPAYTNDKIEGREDKWEPTFEEEGGLKHGEVQDAFGNEEYAEIKYKTLKWWYVFNSCPWPRCNDPNA